MKKNASTWKRYLWWSEKIHSWFSWIVSVVILAIFIWLGLARMFYFYLLVGEKEGIDFAWQMIGFDFILAGLMLNVKESLLIKGQTIILPLLALLFIISGVIIILGYGLLSIPADRGNGWYQLAGLWSFPLSQMLMSLGISIMIVESFRRILAGFDQLTKEKK